jgi:A/G-specific adenine glycosylase
VLPMDMKSKKKFAATVWDFYREHGRHNLLWRQTYDPYRILVSEMMLQQTQVDRVIPKYEAFIKKYPTVEKLARASLVDVLKLWQGLGYNRRAKMLLLCAQKVVQEYKGTFPSDEVSLLKLPGVGPYTAKAILAFAYSIPVSLIETNVRNVYLHHFFHDKTDVQDAEILRLIAVTADTKKPREWYYALMDYGSHLKKTHGNANIKSAHYTKQSTFKGSDRQIRGTIIKLLTKKSYTRAGLQKALSSYEDIRIDVQIESLLKEGMILKKRVQYQLPH